MDWVIKKNQILIKIDKEKDIISKQNDFLDLCNQKINKFTTLLADCNKAILESKKKITELKQTLVELDNQFVCSTMSTKFLESQCERIMEIVKFKSRQENEEIKERNQITINQLKEEIIKIKQKVKKVNNQQVNNQQVNNQQVNNKQVNNKLEPNKQVNNQQINNNNQQIND